MNKGTESFTWLHLSDLHVGMSVHPTLWPNIKQEFYKDIALLHEQTGNWEVVIFSGDLTQKGSVEEYQDLLRILSELWEVFRSLGFDPVFFHVPGNHDLVRPPKLTAEVMVLKGWWQNQEVQNDFWSNKKGQYRKIVQGAFANYEKFKEELKSTGIPLGEPHLGEIPGDSSIVLKSNDLAVGILGLNSAWLQLSDDDYDGKLSIDLRQIVHLVKGGTASWCQSNDINLIVTHHPKEWLHATARQGLDSEINPPGRFDAHLFGHMHEADTTRYSHGGGETKVEVQAASLFGLEYVRDQQKRIHGYSVGKISLSDAGRRLTIWPRVTLLQRSQQWKIVPDHEMTLDKDNSYSIDYRGSSSSRSERFVEPGLSRLDESLQGENDSAKTLNKIYYSLDAAEAHLWIRTAEQNKGIDGLNADRCIWLVSEWGMGADGYLWAIKNRQNHLEQKIYSLDLGDYTSSDDFLESVREKFGCSFAQLCNYLSDQGGSYLILNDIPNVPDGEYATDVSSAIEEISKTVLQYCVNLKIILNSRQQPRSAKYEIVELTPMDQAESLTYIQNHPSWLKSGLKVESISEIYSLSDGAPQVVDTLLSDLEYVALSDLIAMSTDVSNVVSESAAAPSSLIRTIKNLSESDSVEIGRAYQLLKALSVFPNGEGLERLRYFDQRDPFFPAQARTLAGLSLIDASTTLSDVEYGGQDVKTLIVRRAVRDYVLSLIGKSEYIELCKKAASLFFGNAWLHGKIKVNPKYKFDSAQAPSGDIGNANKILRVLFADAFGGTSQAYKAKIIDVCAHFLAKLADGSHYREIQSFCEGLFPYLNDDDPFLLTVRVHYAKAKRMTTSDEEAKQLFIQLSSAPLPKLIKAQVLLNLALCHESLKEHEDVIATARLVKKMAPNSHAAQYAEALIIENDSEEGDAVQKLSRLEARAVTKKDYSAANNIALTLASRASDVSEKVAIYNRVFLRAKSNGDVYNAIRAIVNLCFSKIVVADQDLSDSEELGLIRAYHYLYNQRLGTLFNKCHRALWHVFYSRRDYSSLIRLFRHSSLVWRLGGQDAKEMEYITIISKSAEVMDYKAAGASHNELAYVLSRTSLLT
jgi:predicted MPP superfamily phosphohydrolase